jgi:hypothetical protein
LGFALGEIGDVVGKVEVHVASVKRLTASGWVAQKFSRCATAWVVASVPCARADPSVPRATRRVESTAQPHQPQSAQAQSYGTFDYNRTPLASPDTRVLVHEMSSARSTWYSHTANGWYRVPATNHYRCYRVYVQEISPNESLTHSRVSQLKSPCPPHPPPTCN